MSLEEPGGERPGPIVLTLSVGTAETSGFLQRLAGFELWSPAPLSPGARPEKQPASRPLVVDATWSVVHDGPGLDLGEVRRVLALRSASGQHRFDYEDGETFLVDAGGGRIERLRAAVGAAPAMRSLERALGAPLIVALAVRGVHVLHASAIDLGGTAIALTAPSGIGKSTLAAAAERAAGRSWRRIADDLLPVRLGASAAALPHFPQLKLPSQAQYPAEAPASLPLRAVVALERRTAAAPFAFDRLDPARAAVELAQATVAARWFDKEPLAAHLVACTEATATVQVARLSYPSGLDHLEELFDRLASELG